MKLERPFDIIHNLLWPNIIAKTWIDWGSNAWNGKEPVLSRRVVSRSFSESRPNFHIFFTRFIDGSTRFHLFFAKRAGRTNAPLHHPETPLRSSLKSIDLFIRNYKHSVNYLNMLNKWFIFLDVYKSFCIHNSVTMCWFHIASLEYFSEFFSHHMRIIWCFKKGALVVTSFYNKPTQLFCCSGTTQKVCCYVYIQRSFNMHIFWQMIVDSNLQCRYLMVYLTKCEMGLSCCPRGMRDWFCFWTSHNVIPILKIKKSEYSSVFYSFKLSLLKCIYILSLFYWPKYFVHKNMVCPNQPVVAGAR